jgi:anaerobic selenocysteine-containing dehydrogenase
MDVCPKPYAEMSWKDIKALGLKEGDKVKISDASGASVETEVKFSRRAVEGSVVVPFHFSTLKLNSLTHWDKPVIKVKVEKA